MESDPLQSRGSALIQRYLCQMTHSDTGRINSRSIIAQVLPKCREVPTMKSLLPSSALQTGVRAPRRRHPLVESRSLTDALVWKNLVLASPSTSARNIPVASISPFRSLMNRASCCWHCRLSPLINIPEQSARTGQGQSNKV